MLSIPPCRQKTIESLDLFRFDGPSQQKRLAFLSRLPTGRQQMTAVGATATIQSGATQISSGAKTTCAEAFT